MGTKGVPFNPPPPLHQRDSGGSDLRPKLGVTPPTPSFAQPQGVALIEVDPSVLGGSVLFRNQDWISIQPGTTQKVHVYYRNTSMDSARFQYFVEGTDRWGYPPEASQPVMKKDRTVHWANDFRALNLHTVPDSFLTPNIADVLQTFAGSKCFSTLDASQAYMIFR